MMSIQRILQLLILLGWIFVASGYRPLKNGHTIKVSCISRPAVHSHNAYYVNDREPLQHLFFAELPIGNILPQGWLLKCLQLENNGLTGHLEEISWWLEKKNNAWLNPYGKGSNGWITPYGNHIHGWEEMPYWLKGYANMGYVLHDPAIIKNVEMWINAVLKSQPPDGYFGPLTLKNGKPDLWPNMIMLWCLQSYYDYSHDARVLPFITRYFRWESNLPDSMFLKDYWENNRAGDNLYSVYWLYNRIGESWLLDLAKKIHHNMANWELPDNLPSWHNVNIAQGFREPATYYLQTGDSSDMEATYRDFHLVRNIYGQVPGGMFGADENARTGYTDPRQGIETCGMVEQMSSDEILLRFTGDPSWADNCENVAFNTYPAALMPNFKALRQFTAPNMVTSDAKNHSPGIQDLGPFFIMNPLSNRCCQHNHSQGWPYYAENLWMATQDNGLAAVLYAASKVTAQVGNGAKVIFQEKTHYPFSDIVQFIVHTAHNVRFPLYLRVPSWCNHASISINNIRQNITSQPDTYIRIENIWKEGDKITLQLPMRIFLTRWTKNKNSVSVNYGPLTFSLKIKEHFIKTDPRKTAQIDSRWQSDIDFAEWPAYEIFPVSPWNYGLRLDDTNPIAGFKLVYKAWPKNNFPFTPESVPIELVTTGKQIPTWTLDKYGLCGLLPQSPLAVNTPAKQIILIPMGATRLRISALPVVE